MKRRDLGHPKPIANISIGTRMSSRVEYWLSNLARNSDFRWFIRQSFCLYVRRLKTNKKKITNRYTQLTSKFHVRKSRWAATGGLWDSGLSCAANQDSGWSGCRSSGSWHTWRLSKRAGPGPPDAAHLSLKMSACTFFHCLRLSEY